MTIDVPAPPPGTALASLRSLPVLMRGSRIAYALSVAMNVLAVLSAATAAALSAFAVSLAVLGRADGRDLAALAVGVGVAVAARGVCSWLEAWLSHDVAFRAMARVRAWVFRAIARVAPGGIAGRRVGDLATATLADSEALEVFAAHSSLYILSAWVTTPVLLAAVATISPVTAVSLLPVLLLVVSATLLLRRRARADGARLRAARAELTADIAEDARAVREIVGFGLESQRMARAAELDRAFTAAQLRTVRRAGAENAIAGASPILAIVVAALLGSQAVVVGSLDRSLLPVLITVAALTPSAILQWVGVTRHYGTTREAAARIEALLDAPDPVDRTGDALVAGSGALAARAEVVQWRWPAAPRDAVCGVTVTIDAGERVAVVGRSGAGKSTFAQLLARFMDPASGRIVFDATDARSLGVDGLADAVCLVPQDVHLFAETVRDNLRLATARPVTDEECWAALETTLAAETVRGLPEGLDSMLGAGGRSLSGGERQRIALARTLLTGSRVLVLDETVSQLDVESERDVSAAISRGSGRTVIVIAHRLSTILRADRILVLDEGRLVGDGTHEALFSTVPAYRDLVAPQLRALR
ncbi:ABC transporter ATP-binding protein [Microbacterium sp.]|uniref:ABC transporter ATP-binding protein n=1 Tax=Microbacterium sp. TaxID=51671 RepID=UPI0039E2FA4C